MTKISEQSIRTPDPRLKEQLSDIVTLWNLGKYSFNEISTVPTDTPDDAEMRVFRSGASYRLYVYIPSLGGWAYAQLT